jgi:hypothetical protein
MQIAKVATRKFSENVKYEELLKEKESKQNQSVTQNVLLAHEAEKNKVTKKEKEVLLDDFNF